MAPRSCFVLLAIYHASIGRPIDVLMPSGIELRTVTTGENSARAPPSYTIGTWGAMLNRFYTSHNGSI